MGSSPFKAEETRGKAQEWGVIQQVWGVVRVQSDAAPAERGGAYENKAGGAHSYHEGPEIQGNGGWLKASEGEVTLSMRKTVH